MQINNKIFHSCRTLDESRLSPDFIDFGCWKNILNKMMIKITRLWNHKQVLKIANLFRKLSSRNQFKLHFSSALTAFHTFFAPKKKVLELFEKVSTLTHGDIHLAWVSLLSHFFSQNYRLLSHQVCCFIFQCWHALFDSLTFSLW